MGTSAPRRLLFSAAALLLLLLLLCGPAAGSYVSYANQWLIPHNLARRAVGVRPLHWDYRVAQYAQWYAYQRIWDCALVHSYGPYGENIFWGSGWGWTPAQAAGAWTAEKRWFNYWANRCVDGEDCGHYTQVVWRETTRLGCAMVECHHGRGVFGICSYNPPGNYYGERPY